MVKLDVDTELGLINVGACKGQRVLVRCATEGVDRGRRDGDLKGVLQMTAATGADTYIDAVIFRNNGRKAEENVVVSVALEAFNLPDQARDQHVVCYAGCPEVEVAPRRVSNDVRRACIEHRIVGVVGRRVSAELRG